MFDQFHLDLVEIKIRAAARKHIADVIRNFDADEMRTALQGDLAAAA